MSGHTHADLPPVPGAIGFTRTEPRLALSNAERALVEKREHAQALMGSPASHTHADLPPPPPPHLVFRQGGHGKPAHWIDAHYKRFIELLAEGDAEGALLAQLETEVPEAEGAPWSHARHLLELVAAVAGIEHGLGPYDVVGLGREPLGYSFFVILREADGSHEVVVPAEVLRGASWRGDRAWERPEPAAVQALAEALLESADRATAEREQREAEEREAAALRKAERETEKKAAKDHPDEPAF